MIMISSHKYNDFFRHFSIPVLCILTPLAMVCLCSFCFFLNIPASSWQGWLCLLASYWLVYKYDSKNFKRNFLTYSLIWVGAVLLSAIFIFCDSYDSTICHRPAAFMFAKGWNPVFVSTIREIHNNPGLNFSGISLAHIAYQPKGVWMFAGIGMLMSGIPTADIWLFVLFSVSAGYICFEFAETFFKAPKWIKFAFIAVVLAMPKVSQATVGQIDYLIYISTILLNLSLILYVKKRTFTLLYLAVLLSVWLPNIKINGLAIVIFSWVVWGTYFVIQNIKNKSPLADKNGLFIILTGIIITLVIGFNPYITNSLNYGGPLYPAHTFNQEIKITARDLTDDFIGNKDSEEMGHIGRISYAWFSKKATLKYYQLKLRKPDFSPWFQVAEGVDGFKTVFRVIMVFGTLCWLMTRRSIVDIVILVLMISTFALPTKYIGYARYSPQIWCIPFIMILNFASIPKSFFERRRKILVISGGILCLIYTTLVIGRLVFFYLFCLERSIARMENFQNLRDNEHVYIATSNPAPVWNQNQSVSFPQNNPYLYSYILLSQLIPNDQFQTLTFSAVPENLLLPIKENVRVFFTQHGFFTIEGTAQEFSAFQAKVPPNNLRGILDFPIGSVFKKTPKYLYWIICRRLNAFWDYL
jgi:hypothetical protein